MDSYQLARPRFGDCDYNYPNLESLTEAFHDNPKAFSPETAQFILESSIAADAPIERPAFKGVIVTQPTQTPTV